jgi:hypothetical protein
VDRTPLITALSSRLPGALSTDLVDEYLQMRQDLATGTLGRSSVGKFVETLAQALQHLDAGTHAAKPNVDAYLLGLESSGSSTLPDGLKIVAARVGRSMYTMRNKRNIAHKGEVDPSRFDLQYLVGAAQWVLAELIRAISGLPMQQAGALVEQISAPVGGLVQDFGDRRLVLADLTIRDEIVVLMHNVHPTPMTLADLRKSLDRRSPNRVQAVARDLWQTKHLEGGADSGYRLTHKGFDHAVQVIQSRLA